MTRRAAFEQTASIPLVLLVVIVVGGVVLALFGIVRTGTSAVGRDRDFASAIQIADAGVQDAYLTLLALDDNELDDTDFDPCPHPSGLGVSNNSPDSGICATVAGEFDDAGFVYEYARVGESRNWQVQSWGAYRDSTRMVTANVGVTSLFTTAMLADETLRLNAAANCDTDNPFSAGAGGAILFRGQSGGCISAVTIFNDPLGSTVPGSDFGVFDINCDSADDGECLVTYSHPDALGDLMVNRAIDAFESANGDCSGSTESSLEVVDGTITLDRGSTYCVNNEFLEIDGNTPIVVDGSDGDGFAHVYVRGSIAFETQAEVNVGQSAGHLLFDVGGPIVAVQGNAVVSAGIYAPAASCVSNGGAGSFAGAMTCSDITINGNWRYDSSVQDIDGSSFAIRNWAEVPPGSGPPVAIDLGP